MRYAIFLIILPASIAGAGDDILMGFDAASSTAQRSIETTYDRDLQAKDLDAWMKRLSARPHHAGSAAGKENAEFIAELFRAWGFDTDIEIFDILLPTPKTRELELLEPTQFKASLEEDSLDEDPSTLVRENLLPPYNAFSVDGEVEGELVFVNYGIPEDYDRLERYGIDLTGKIAIAKYGKSWRGIKPKVAAEHGAIGCIIYSDPADDGYAKGDVYPKGAFKHESGVQRGSVMDMPQYTGDVLTPGVGATGRAKRLDIDEAQTLTKIPVLPISYRDALPLLSAIGGEVVPDEWRGALPITYHIGPGPATVRIKLEFNWDRVEIYNVVARMEGSRFPDEWVIRGNHHDGWNHGAADPISGLVALLAEARSVGRLAASGTRPARTLIYAAWDAEEPGLIGSTEWVEQHAADLKKNAVAYINTDGNSRGFIDIDGSHVLEKFFNQIIDEIDDPQTSVSVADRKRAHIRVTGDDDAKAEVKERDDLRLDAMGSGSDYTPFIQHLGISAADLGFQGEGDGGSYHTLYDTYEHYSTWRDPEFVYGVTLASAAGRATLRLANAHVLPFEYKALADSIDKYLTELEELTDTMRAETAESNEMIADGIYAAALDPTKTLGPPKEEEPVPFFNFAPLKNGLNRLQKAAAGYDTALAVKKLSDDELADFNRLLYTSERLLTREAGLAGRPWYKHQLYAPGYYTGYGVKTIPGVREAIEQRQYDQVEAEIEIAAAVLNDVAARVETLNDLLNE